MPDEDGLREALLDFVALLPPDRWPLLYPKTQATVASLTPVAVPGELGFLRSTPAAPQPNEHVYSCCPHEDAAPQPDPRCDGGCDNEGRGPWHRPTCSVWACPDHKMQPVTGVACLACDEVQFVASTAHPSTPTAPQPARYEMDLDGYGYVPRPDPEGEWVKYEDLAPAAHQHRFDVVIRDDEHMRLLGCSNTPCAEVYQWDH